MTNNRLPEWRTALNDAAENYQSAWSWYEENQDSTSAEQDVDAAADVIKQLIKQYGVLIVLSLLDEIDELQERRSSAAPELKPAHLTNKFYERYPLDTFKNDGVRAEQRAQGVEMAIDTLLSVDTVAATGAVKFVMQQFATQLRNEVKV